MPGTGLCRVERDDPLELNETKVFATSGGHFRLRFHFLAVNLESVWPVGWLRNTAVCLRLVGPANDTLTGAVVIGLSQIFRNAK